MANELTDEQKRASAALLQNALRSRDVQAFQGPGGSGKSYVMRDVATALRSEGWEVLFSTMSHSALAACPAGFARMVLASLVVKCGWKHHPHATPAERLIRRWMKSTRRVLVIDEAYQLRSDYLIRVFNALQGYSHVTRGGVRVILVGDPGQMKPIGGKPITAHPDVQRAKVTRLTSGTMRMTLEWAQEVCSFGENVVFADASISRHRRHIPPATAMIITPTRKDSIGATRKFLAGPSAVTILPLIPEDDETEDVSTPESRKASEPFICDPEQPSRLVYNVRTINGDRVTLTGFGLNNNARVRFAGIVDKQGDRVNIAPGSQYALRKTDRVRIRVEGESDPITLAPVLVNDICAVPLRPYGVKTVHAAQGETIAGGVYLYADGPVAQSVYVTAAGRVSSAEKFAVDPAVTRVDPDP